MKLSGFVFLAFSILISPTFLVGQEETPPASPAKEEKVDEGNIDQERVFEDQIVVTASRQEQDSADTPASITVITREDIERQQPAKLVDLFKQVPGVEISGEGPFRGLPVIRGFSSNRVLILIDGQRLNNARESTVFAGIQPGLVALSDIERIEVLRGPASVLYGSDAMGGVINIITKVPDLGADKMQWKGSAHYGYGENANAHRANIDIQAIGNRYSLRVAGGIQDIDDYYAPMDAVGSERFGDYVDDDARVYNSGMSQTNFDAGLRLLTGDLGVFKIGAEVVRTSDIGFPGFDPEEGIDIEFPRFDRDKLSLVWDSGPVKKLSNISLSTYYQQTTKESRRNLDFGPFFYLLNTTISEIDSFGFTALSTADFGINHLTFGLDFYTDHLDDDTLSADPFSGESTDVAVPKSNQTGIGIYIQDEMQVNEKTMILAGLRGDNIHFKSEDDPDYPGEPFDVTESDISGNIGLTYKITDKVSLTGLIARGFRAPNLQERSYTGFPSEPGFFIVQNPDLTSERSLNYEFGFKARYDRYFGGLNVFYNDVTDLITLVELGPDPETGYELLQYDNIAAATIKGIEFELETIFYEDWTSFLTASYTHGQDDTIDQPLPFIPPFKFVFGLRYQQPSWWAEGSLRWMAEQTRVPDIDDVDTNEVVGDFQTVDLRAGYDFDCGFSIQGVIGNVFDELYAEPFNNRPEPGRNFGINFAYEF